VTFTAIATAYDEVDALGNNNNVICVGRDDDGNEVLVDDNDH
jgi:hypothetical protein